jgi:hypothetical protein
MYVKAARRTLVKLTSEDDAARKYVSSANIEKPERVNNSFSFFCFNAVNKMSLEWFLLEIITVEAA